MSVDESLETLGRLSRAARGPLRVTDLSAGAVDSRLRRLSQLHALCQYLMRMKPTGSDPLTGPASVRTRRDGAA
jgi:hypothetical protein